MSISDGREKNEQGGGRIRWEAHFTFFYYSLVVNSAAGSELFVRFPAFNRWLPCTALRTWCWNPRGSDAGIQRWVSGPDQPPNTRALAGIESRAEDCLLVSAFDSLSPRSRWPRDCAFLGTEPEGKRQSVEIAESYMMQVIQESKPTCP